MKQIFVSRSAPGLRFVAALACLLLNGCLHDAPITAEPTRRIEPKLLGDWATRDGENKLKVRKLEDSTYILALNGFLLRAHHSDLAGTPFVSVQDLETQERKFTYITWTLSADGTVLNWRAIRKKAVPEGLKNPKEVQDFLQRNLKNPDLFDDPQEYTKVP